MLDDLVYISGRITSGTRTRHIGLLITTQEYSLRDGNVYATHTRSYEIGDVICISERYYTINDKKQGIYTKYHSNGEVEETRLYEDDKEEGFRL